MRRVAPILILIMLMPLTGIKNMLIVAEVRAAARQFGIIGLPAFHEVPKQMTWHSENGMLVPHYAASLQHDPLRIEVEWLLSRITNDCGSNVYEC